MYDELIVTIYFIFYLQCSKLEPVGNYHHDKSHSSQILEKLCCTTGHLRGSSNTNISECQGNYLRTDLYSYEWVTTKHPAHIMLLGVVTNNGDVMLPFISPHGRTPNSQVYIKCLDEVVLTWIEKMAAGRPWQENCEPCHTGKKTQCLLWGNFFDDVSLTSSRFPDCNPFWLLYVGAVEWEMNKTPCNTNDGLKARITTAFTNLNRETMGRFGSRLEAVVEVNDDFCE